MKLEIEEDRVATAHKFFNDGRPGCDVQLKPYLEPLALVSETIGQPQCRICSWDIERNNQVIARDVVGRLGVMRGFWGRVRLERILPEGG